jgi:hypothetical protein
MPKKDRRGVGRRDEAVGPQAVKLYAKMLRLERQGRHYWDEERQLRQLLQLRPWQPSLFAVPLVGELEVGPFDEAHQQDFKHVQAIRRALHRGLRPAA